MNHIRRYETQHDYCVQVWRFYPGDTAKTPNVYTFTLTLRKFIGYIKIFVDILYSLSDICQKVEVAFSWQYQAL